jgi:hypothetical protein
MDVMTFLRNQWDRVAAWVAIGLGALLLLLGWLGVSDTVYPAEQLPFIISGGVGGACLIGIGAMLWLSADLRDEWTELQEISKQLAQANGRADSDGDAGTNGSATEPDAPAPRRRRGARASS